MSQKPIELTISWMWQSEVSNVAETSNTMRQKCFRDRDIIKKFLLSDETRFQNKMG